MVVGSGGCGGAGYALVFIRYGSGGNCAVFCSVAAEQVAMDEILLELTLRR